MIRYRPESSRLPPSSLISRSHRWISSLGSGLVDERVNSTTKMLGGKASFLIGTLQALASYRPQKVEIRVDDEPWLDGEMVTCAVANGQYFGGGMHFAPHAELDDGLFEVVVQVRSGVREVLSVGDLYNGRAIDWASVRHTRGASVEARATDPGDHVLIDVDGEQPGRLPARFSMFDSAIRLKV